jgi:SAM-dependent methyltransferase
VSQTTTGLRSALSNPAIYDTLQWLMGGRIGRTDFTQHMVKATGNARILDIGCGTGDILAFLPVTAEYWGFDPSDRYIAAARRRFGSRGCFVKGLADESKVNAMRPFDIVVASGLLHHLDDDAVRILMRIVRIALRDGGRFATIDPVFVSGQSHVARLLIKGDRGRHVRDPEGYAALVRTGVDQLRGVLRHRRWIPYTHWMMEGTIEGSPSKNHRRVWSRFRP